MGHALLPGDPKLRCMQAKSNATSAGKQAAHTGQGQGATHPTPKDALLKACAVRMQ